jgi:S1-C subfamily serine protease
VDDLYLTFFFLLETGDVITHINEKPIRSALDVYKSLETAKELRLTLCRRSQVMKLSVVPDD